MTAAQTLAEVEEYAAALARRKRLPADIVLLAVAAMPVTVVEPSSRLPRARKLIARRDPDDVDVLALALHLKIPLWSNDKDFQGTGIELLTTEALLRRLRLI